MDLYFLFSAFFGMFSLVLNSGLAAPTADPRPLAHVRTKRCSCATFLDKECVYFCHLDIIWVNTPERVVSYGLGNAPRAKRSAPGSDSTAPRCRCLRENDRKCNDFCHREQDLSGPDKILSPKLRAVVKSRTILEKWRLKRRHRSRQWDAQSSAS